jgi:hypothetical protein
VRTIRRDHSTAGTEHTIIWDGRDENGLRLPDGVYRVTVQQFSLPITLDSTPPQAVLILQDPYQPVPRKRPAVDVVGVAPLLRWAVTEPHVRQVVIERASIEKPDQWQPFITLGPQQTLTKHSFDL